MRLNDGDILANIQPPLFKVDSSVRNEYTQDRNYPNPFNPPSVIKYKISKSGKDVLKAFNTLGQEMRMLVKEEKGSGYHQVNRDGIDMLGKLIYKRAIRDHGPPPEKVTRISIFITKR